MCGIVGFWKPNGYQGNIKNNIAKMTNTLIHRGPDDFGVYIDRKNGMALGHRRLSILELSPLGHQPMESLSGRFAIVYNGEVYNFLDLRKELENFHNIRFKGNSDTEVILMGFEIWGVKGTLKKMNGMFALALWDKKKEKLILARDRIGIKPLYFGINNGILFFASELKAIRANPRFSFEIDRNALALYFRHNYIPDPHSIYKGIKKLHPGHWVEIDKKLNIKLHCYWNAQEITEKGLKIPFNKSETELIDELETLLKDSVKKRMIADVPLGAFLSGGIDSSTVVALMQSQSSMPVKTFSIGFYEDGYNEANFAKQIAKHLRTDHTELYVTPKETMDVIPKLPEIYDEPFADSSQIPTFLVSQLTKKSVTVSLSGDGGDELFGGYNRYFLAKNIWSKIGWMIPPAKQFISLIIYSTPKEILDKSFNWMKPLFEKYGRPGKPSDKLIKLAEVLSIKYKELLYKSLVSHWKTLAGLVLNSTEPETIFDKPEKLSHILNFYEKMMFIDLVTYLPDDILTKVDRASMAVSLEARVPILDHRVVEFSKRLPTGLKIKDNKGKWILKQILYKYVPKELVERPKMGFGVPIDKWLRRPLRDWAETLLSEDKLRKEGFLNPSPIRQKWEEHLSGERNWQYHLWDVLMFEAWLEKWG